MASPSILDPEQITLWVTATVPTAPIVRLTATQLAAQLGFDHDRIGDVRVAVGEALRVLGGSRDVLDQHGARPSTGFRADFTVAATSLRMRITGGNVAAVGGADPDTGAILSATTSAYQLEPDGKPEPSVTLMFDRDDAGG